MGHCKSLRRPQPYSCGAMLFNSSSPLMQDEGQCENDHQLSVAGKIKKHFNTNPKVNDTTAGVSVISVSYSCVTGALALN